MADPVIAVSGKPCLNTRKNKKSYMIITSDTADTFSGATTVKAADSSNGLEWVGQLHDVHDSGKRLQVKMFTKTGTALAEENGAKAVKGGKVKAGGPPPDAGAITVTLENPSKTISSVPVDYIDDGTS
jgi:hypothetical protein